MGTAEEILLNHVGKGVNVRSVYYERTIEAMEEYASQYKSQSQELRKMLDKTLNFLNHSLAANGQEYYEKHGQILTEATKLLNKTKP